MNGSHLDAYAVIKTQANLMFSLRCYAEHRKDICENACHTCSTTFPLLQAMTLVFCDDVVALRLQGLYDLPRQRRRCRVGL